MVEVTSGNQAQSPLPFSGWFCQFPSSARWPYPFESFLRSLSHKPSGDYTLRRVAYRPKPNHSRIGGAQ